MAKPFGGSSYEDYITIQKTSDDGVLLFMSTNWTPYLGTG